MTRSAGGIDKADAARSEPSPVGDATTSVGPCGGDVRGRSCVREQNHIGPHAASQAFADTLDAQQWWLCPNEPRCPHGRVLHDDQGPESTPTCCADGCDCGRAVEHDQPDCIVGEHLWFAGPKGPYCGKCKVPKP